jgi:predicted DNA-binding transcriptional regulator YafY
LNRYAPKWRYNEGVSKEKRSPREKNPEQKLNALYVLLALLWHSDEGHPLTVRQIQEDIAEDFGVSVLRKAVTDAVEALQTAERKSQAKGHFAFTIQEDHSSDRRKTGYYKITERLFSEAELRYLIDAVYSSHAITGEMAKGLIQKIASTLSENEGSHYREIHRAFSNPRSVNRALFVNLLTLEKAIEAKKKVSFFYNQYGLDGKLAPKQNEDGSLKKYVCDPYYLALSNDAYYLICHWDALPDKPIYFRIDFMSGVALLEENELPQSKVPCFQRFDIDKYMNERLFALQGDPTYCTVKIDDPRAVTYLYDRFGKNAQLYEKDGVTYGKIYCAPNAFYFWVMAYADELTVLGPDILVGWMKDTARKILGDKAGTK